MILNRSLRVVLALVLAFFIVSCAATPKQKQFMTLDTFNSMYKEYLDIYDTQPPSIQAEWKAKVDPYWKEASLAMNAYMAITDPDSTEGQRKLAIYKAVRNQALNLLLTYGVEIREE